MKKIGIVTIISNNYGNRLQNFALQTILQSMGYKVETIRRYDYTFVHFVKTYCRYIIKPKINTRFFQFNKRIKWSKCVVDDNFDLSLLDKQYDAFVVGSDQVWNPYYNFTGGVVDFLSFTDNKKKIAYAASFGVTNIPDSKKIEYMKYLENFDCISTREDEGAEIVLELKGRKPLVVLDPVLLLPVSFWRTIEKKPHKMPREKYTLIYVVDKMSSEFKDIIKKEENENKIIYVREKDGKEWANGPCEFLYLIDHAEKIITDSFHGTAFSILFHTPFLICKRDGLDMTSRINTLLNITQLYNEKDEESFERADGYLENRRAVSLKYLEDALNK